MTIVDVIAAAFCVVALAALLLFDKMSRVIVWEILRHPFTPSRVEVRNGGIRVTRGDEAEKTNQPERQAGAR